MEQNLLTAISSVGFPIVVTLLNNPAQVYRKSGQSETVNPAKRNRPFSIENGCAVLGTRELPFLEWQLPFA